MMATDLQDAISLLVSKAQTDGSVLDVAQAAVSLASEHGGNSREIAALITEAGVAARINMKLDGKTGV
jgi:hypothetical protein